MSYPGQDRFEKVVVFVDIDIDYDKFMKHIYEFYERHINWVLRLLGYEAEHIDIQRSTNNHVHVFIRLNKPVRDPYEYLHLMASLWADPGLCSISYFRLKAFGDPLVKAFHRKIRPRGGKQ